MYKITSVAPNAIDLWLSDKEITESKEIEDNQCLNIPYDEWKVIVEGGV